MIIYIVILGILLYDLLYICYLHVLDSEVQQRCHDIWIILPGKWRLGGCAIFKSFGSPIRSVTVDCTHVLESPHLFIPNVRPRMRCFSGTVHGIWVAYDAVAYAYSAVGSSPNVKPPSTLEQTCQARHVWELVLCDKATSILGGSTEASIDAINQI